MRVGRGLGGTGPRHARAAQFDVAEIAQPAPAPAPLQAQRFGRIVQLHGFERTRRASSAAQLVDIIVSDGTRAPGRRIFDLADCLSRSLAPKQVAVYPNDVAELGALTNRQGQALRSEGFDGFVHLEMSAQLRASLVQDPKLRNALASCLMTGLG